MKYSSSFIVSAGDKEIQAFLKCCMHKERAKIMAPSNLPESRKTLVLDVYFNNMKDRLELKERVYECFGSL